MARRMSKDDYMRVWQKLDPSNNGSITAGDAIKHSSLLQAECPKFIANFNKIAIKGEVTRKAFIEFNCFGRKPGSGSAKASKKKTDDVDMDALKQLFDNICGPSGTISLTDIINNKAEVKRVYPKLMDCFDEIDLNKDAEVTWDELRAHVGGTAEWLEYELSKVIGLDDLKDQIRKFECSVSLDKARVEGGHDVQTGGKFHMIFQGNPGTGKTSVGRIIAKLLHRIEIIPTDDLKEVQRDSLVAEYVGQTAVKTTKIIEEAKKGVLFVDEAYRLTSGSKNDFGVEALNTLMGVMNDPPGEAPVMVFAGYVDDMKHFMEANEGLYRRFNYTFNFTDYNCEDLARILDIIVKNAGFTLSNDLVENDYAKLAKILEDNTKPESRSLMNGGVCERIFTFGKQSLDNREVDRAPGTVPSVELIEADIVEACSKVVTPSRDSEPPREAWGPWSHKVSSTVKPPENYEVLPCCLHSWGCLIFWLLRLLTFLYVNLRACAHCSYHRCCTSPDTSGKVTPV